jgi:7-cyano-7-deazaguanine synthase
VLALDAEAAVVLFSGGQDSSVALACALEAHQSVATVGFDYGQRHAVELGARTTVLREIARQFPAWGARLKPDTLIELGALGRISETALTREMEHGLAASGLPNTFVPGRNLVFLTLAAAHAYRLGARVLIGGMCETDFSGYPDCRADALAAQLEALRLGMDADFSLKTPLMRLTKAQSWALAEALGGAALVDLILEHSHSCYRGIRGARHDWGYGCGACAACDLRARGYQEYRAERW